MEYFGDKFRSNNDTCTSKMCSKMRHKGIESVYVGVELLYKHIGTTNGFSIKEFSTT